MIKKLHVALVILIAVMLCNTLQAQTNYCGTTGKSPWLSAYQTDRSAYTLLDDTVWLLVPVTFHIVGTDAGTGYFKQKDALAALCHTNTKYVEARIRFYLHETDKFVYHNNSSWYQHEFNPGGEDMILTASLPDRLNIFIVDYPAGNCGYSWLDATVMGKNCSGATNSTWAHEFGHHFSLPHPFYGWEGYDGSYNQPAPNEIWGTPVERTNGSNCSEAADGFCDTEPDYLSDRWNCNANSRSSTVQTDPDGVTFTSDGTLIMGYANDQCQTRFTPEQIEAMRANLNSEHLSYLTILAAPPGITEAAVPVSPIDTQIVISGNATFSWHPVPGAEFYYFDSGLYPNFIPKLRNQFTTDTFVTITSSFPVNKPLYWRVQAYSSWDLCANTYSDTSVFWVTTPSSANVLESLVGVSLSPNPAAARAPLHLAINALEAMPLHYTIVNIHGTEVFRGETAVFEGENKLEVPTLTLSAGAYQLVLHNEKGIFSHFFVLTQ